MFNDIVSVHRQRAANQVELLASFGPLGEPLGLGDNCVGAVLAGLDRLGSPASERFLSGHRAHGWLQRVRSALLDAYEQGEPAAAEPLLREMVLHFELGLAMIAGVDYTFRLQEGFARRFLLPGSSGIVDLGGPAQLPYYYRADSSSIEQQGIRFPVVKFPEVCGMWIVDGHLDLFADPTDDQYPVELEDSIDVAAWVGALAAARGLIARDMGVETLVAEFVTHVVPLRQRSVVQNLSFSARRLPGVVFKSDEIAPSLIGETLVHEADHQFFYAIDQLGKVWENDVRSQTPVFYSPWRDDPRPLDGLLRGLSAFARVSRYYSSLLSVRNLLRSADEAAAVAILARRLCESEVALQTVQDSGELSNFGLDYLDGVRATLHAVKSDSAGFPGFGEQVSREAAENEARRRAWYEVNRRNVLEERARPRASPPSP